MSRSKLFPISIALLLLATAREAAAATDAANAAPTATAETTITITIPAGLSVRSPGTARTGQDKSTAELFTAGGLCVRTNLAMPAMRVSALGSGAGGSLSVMERDSSEPVPFTIRSEGLPGSAPAIIDSPSDTVPVFGAGHSERCGNGGTNFQVVFAESRHPRPRAAYIGQLTLFLEPG